MTWDVREGHVLDLLRLMPAESVHCVVTSPPYWGLRDYKVDGQLGLENTPAAYVATMVELFGEVRRVLRDDGTCWLNLGDSYAGSWGAMSHDLFQKAKRAGMNTRPPMSYAQSGVKPKNLIGIPWRVAFALQADGWYLRSDIIWSKPNPMPESVTDRPTKAHEYLFLLSKRARYYYDADAIKEPGISEGTVKMPDGWDTGPGAHGAFHRNGREKGRKTLPETQQRLGAMRDKQRGHSRRHAGFNDRWDQMEKTEQCSGYRNKRTVWTIATRPFPEAHFATFPEKLVEPCIKAGCPQGGVVLDPFCGSGTTGVVALKLGRAFVGLELNPAYCAMARRRIGGVMPLFESVAA